MRLPRFAAPRIAAVLVLFAGAWTAPAEGQLGVEFQVNSYTTDSQTFPAVAADAAGNFVVVWSSRYQDGAGGGVFGQQFDSVGNPVAAEFQVNSHTTDDQVYPAVAADPAGNFIVVWQSNAQDGSYFGVFAQRFDSGGNAVASEFQVNSFTTGNQDRPKVTVIDAAGNFVVVWESLGQSGVSSSVFGQRFSSAGSALASEFQVNSNTTFGQGRPVVAAGAAGGFVVAWVGDALDGSGAGIFGRRFDTAGNPVASEFQVNSYTDGTQNRPAISSGGAGNFVVVWTSLAQDGSSGGIFGQRFDAGGNPVASEFQVNSFTTSYQRSPSVASDAAGNFVVTWASFYQEPESWGIFGQLLDSAGNPVALEFQINAYTSASQDTPAVAIDPAGNFLVAWSSDGQDGSSHGIFAALGERIVEPSVLEIPTAGTVGLMLLALALGGAALLALRR